MKSFVFSGISILMGTCVYAETIPVKTNSDRYFIELYSYGYEEPSVMTKDSEIAFFSLGWQDYGMAGSDGFIGNARYFYGTTEYASTSTGTTSGDPTSGVQAELAHKWSMTDYDLFAGLGYRRLFDDWGGKVSSTNNWTYDRRSEYFYAPIGILNHIEGGGYFKGQFNYLIEGTQTSYLSDGGSYSDVTSTQNSGYGLELEYSPQSNYAVFLRYWDIDDGTVESRYSTYEPNNTTTELGFKWLF